MKPFTKFMWCGFVVTASMFGYGLTHADTSLGKTLLFASYVFGFPLLIGPLFLLAEWSTERKNRKLEEKQKG